MLQRSLTSGVRMRSSSPEPAWELQLWQMVLAAGPLMASMLGSSQGTPIPLFRLCNMIVVRTASWMSQTMHTLKYQIQHGPLKVHASYSDDCVGETMRGSCAWPHL